jgi:DNA repair exonuclease SbcCD ATPase subunit
MDKKVENLDDSIKKLDEKLKTDESTESVEETSSDELKELEELKDAGILTEEEFQQKKEEILSLESTSSQIEEETTPDKTVCDICKGEEWDEEDEGSDKLYEGYEVVDLLFDEHELEEPVALWCGMCMDTYMAKGTVAGVEAEYYKEDDGETVIIGDEEAFNEAVYPHIVNAIREWKGNN